MIDQSMSTAVADFALATFAVTALATEAEYPGDLCCDIYSGLYDGDMIKLCYDSSSTSQPNVFMMTDYSFENKVKSYWCGKSIYYDFFYLDGYLLYLATAAGNIKSPADNDYPEVGTI